MQISANFFFLISLKKKRLGK